MIENYTKHHHFNGGFNRRLSYNIRPFYNYDVHYYPYNLYNTVPPEMKSTTSTNDFETIDKTNVNSELIYIGFGIVFFMLFSIILLLILKK